MEGDLATRIIVSLVLLATTIFFVAAEYAFVGSRKSRLEALARRKNKNAKRVIEALDSLGTYVALSQVGVTVSSIGIGSITEPFITELLEKWLGKVVPHQFGFAISLTFVTFVMVIVGELVPKYVALDRPEKIAIALIAPLKVLATILGPVLNAIEWCGQSLVRVFGVKVDINTEEAIPREELLLLVKSGSSQGVMDRVHAEMVAKAFQIDRLQAHDIMIHRIDIKWLQIDLDKVQLFNQLAAIGHTRIPVCREDIDDVVGVVYINDIVKAYNSPKIELEKLARPAVRVPESLTLDRVISTMRDEKSQIVLVVDEYGGTSGIITLEDVVEEIFGDLEDSIEGERASIEVVSSGRISAKADVRFDELISYLAVEWDDEPNTQTLANLVIDELGRMPRLGDSVSCPVGIIRIENMARRRVTRVTIQLNQEFAAKVAAASAMG